MRLLPAYQRPSFRSRRQVYVGFDRDGEAAALQRYLNSVGDYNLAVDGDVGEATRAAFWDFNGKTGC